MARRCLTMLLTRPYLMFLTLTDSHNTVTRKWEGMVSLIFKKESLSMYKTEASFLLRLSLLGNICLINCVRQQVRIMRIQIRIMPISASTYTLHYTSLPKPLRRTMLIKTCFNCKELLNPHKKRGFL